NTQSLARRAAGGLCVFAWSGPVQVSAQRGDLQWISGALQCFEESRLGFRAADFLQDVEQGQAKGGIITAGSSVGVVVKNDIQVFLQEFANRRNGRRALFFELLQVLLPGVGLRVGQRAVTQIDLGQRGEGLPGQGGGVLRSGGA